MGLLLFLFSCPAEDKWNYNYSPVFHRIPRYYPLSIGVGTAESYGARGCRRNGLGFGGAEEGPQRSLGRGERYQGTEQDRKVYGEFTSLTAETLAVLYGTWHLLGWTCSLYQACCAGRPHSLCAKTIFNNTLTGP